MKFIGTIQKTQLKENKLDIFISRELRAAIGARTNTKLYAYPVLTERDNYKHREIFFSQYPPVFWNNIFRLRFWAEDSPGVTEKIFEKPGSSEEVYL